MSGAVQTRAERIAWLNDLARRAMGIACVVVATESIRALSEVDQSRLRDLVETYDAFTPYNHPYGERNFGAIYQGVDGVWSALRLAYIRSVRSAPAVTAGIVSRSFAC